MKGFLIKGKDFYSGGHAGAQSSRPGSHHSSSNSTLEGDQKTFWLTQYCRFGVQKGERPQILTDAKLSIWNSPADAPDAESRPAGRSQGTVRMLSG